MARGDRRAQVAPFRRAASPPRLKSLAEVRGHVNRVPIYCGPERPAPSKMCPQTRAPKLHMPQPSCFAPKGASRSLNDPVDVVAKVAVVRMDAEHPPRSEREVCDELRPVYLQQHKAPLCANRSSLNSAPECVHRGNIPLARPPRYHVSADGRLSAVHLSPIPLALLSEEEYHSAYTHASQPTACPQP